MLLWSKLGRGYRIVLKLWVIFYQDHKQLLVIRVAEILPKYTLAVIVKLNNICICFVFLKFYLKFKQKNDIEKVGLQM